MLPLLLAPAIAMAQPELDWVDAKTRAVCQRVGSLLPPDTDQPTPAQIQALKDCHSEALYYGEGTKPDYVKARLCAFIEDETPADTHGDVFRGKTILMQIYANGLGVKRNSDLATAYACGLPATRDEIAGRIADLQSLKPVSARYDYCDEISSSIGTLYCQQRDSILSAIGRDTRLAALTRHLPMTAKRLYTRMKARFDAFVEAHGDEMDQPGPGGIATAIAEQDSTRDRFASDLGTLIPGHWRHASAQDFGTADRALDKSYRATVAAARDPSLATVRPHHIRKAERRWLSYRNATLRFASALRSGMDADTVLTHMNRQRSAQLDQVRSQF